MIGPSQIIRIEREEHAAHCPVLRRPLHDLEWFHVRAAWRLGYYPRRPAEVPADAEYHSGYRDSDGVQAWLWVRRVPPRSASCSRCAVRTRGAA